MAHPIHAMVNNEKKNVAVYDQLNAIFTFCHTKKCLSSLILNGYIYIYIYICQYVFNRQLLKTTGLN